MPEQPANTINEEKLQNLVQQSEPSLVDSTVSSDSATIGVPVTSKAIGSTITQKSELPSMESVNVIASVPVIPEEPVKESQYIPNNVDTTLSVLEARCRRFGIPFDAAKYTMQKPSAGQNTQRGSVAKMLLGWLIGQQETGGAEKEVWSCEWGEKGDEYEEGIGLYKASFWWNVCGGKAKDGGTDETFRIIDLTYILFVGS